MNEKEIKALVKAIEQLFGNPIDAEDQEVDAIYADFAPEIDPAKRVFEVASKAAQKYRLEGKTVPAHVLAALSWTRRKLFGESVDAADPRSIIEALLTPTRGPVEQVSFAYRNRKECSKKDRELLEKLSRKLREDWSEESE
jgi:hypothetical protein